MTENEFTHSQPSRNPLVIKGVFSTNRRTKVHSRYSYPHNRLHHIKFLGIGTYKAIRYPDVLGAVVVRVGDGDGLTHVYSVRQNRSKNALVGEELALDKGVQSGFVVGSENVGDRVLEAVGGQTVFVAAMRLHYGVSELASLFLHERVSLRGGIAHEEAHGLPKVRKSAGMQDDVQAERDDNLVSFISGDYLSSAKTAFEVVWEALADCGAEVSLKEAVAVYCELLLSDVKELQGSYAELHDDFERFLADEASSRDSEVLREVAVNAIAKISGEGVSVEATLDNLKRTVLDRLVNGSKVLKGDNVGGQATAGAKNVGGVPAKIDFQHEIASEDALHRKMLLDSLADGFNKLLNRYGDQVQEEGGILIKLPTHVEVGTEMESLKSQNIALDGFRPSFAELEVKEKLIDLGADLFADGVGDGSQATLITVEAADSSAKDRTALYDFTPVHADMLVRDRIVQVDGAQEGELVEKQCTGSAHVGEHFAESEGSETALFPRDDHEIAVLSCTPPDWAMRTRPPLEKDRVPEIPGYEQVCDDYVCDGWLQFPLVEFGGEPDNLHDENCNPVYGTGRYDEFGNEYILPPYTILNEPLSQGVEKPGTQMMPIDPRNLYDVIHYLVKLYDALKPRLVASSPVDAMSRVMNMLYGEIEKLCSEWDEAKSYTCEEMWRIYRFVRWMAIGATMKYYRLKLVREYGDFTENFEGASLSDRIDVDGAVVRQTQFTSVLDGHSLAPSRENVVEMRIEVPVGKSSTISFDLGNHVAERPFEDVSGVRFFEDFEGDSDSFKIKGQGWVPAPSPVSSAALGIEHPAKAQTYVTNYFGVDDPDGVSKITCTFNYRLLSNTEAYLALAGSREIWRSSNTHTEWGRAAVEIADANEISRNRFSFRAFVPQAEGNLLVPIPFTVADINSKWTKVGYQTNWEVVGDTIREDENTPDISAIVNEAWSQDSEYMFECTFRTTGSSDGLEDWIGFVFNYRDPDNYYAVGAYGRTSPGVTSYNGVWKVVNGVGKPYEWTEATWAFDTNFRWEYNKEYLMKVQVNQNTFKVFINGLKVLEATDPYGWGYGASGLAAYSNPRSQFRNFKYYARPYVEVLVDNVKMEVEATRRQESPTYAIDFFLDDTDTPRISNYTANAKSTFSFPMLSGEHKAKWVFRKTTEPLSMEGDLSFIDNIVVTNIEVTGCRVEEEKFECGGHFAVRTLIDNLLEYYRRHHEGCQGRRDIWIVE